MLSYIKTGTAHSFGENVESLTPLDRIDLLTEAEHDVRGVEQALVLGAASGIEIESEQAQLLSEVLFCVSETMHRVILSMSADHNLEQE